MRASQKIRHALRIPSPETVLCAGIAFNILSSQSFRLGFPIGPDRILIFLAFVMLWSDPDRRNIGTRRGLVLGAIYIAWSLASVFITADLFDTVVWFALLDRTIVPLMLFWCGSAFFEDWRSRDRLLKTLTLVGIYLGATAIGEIFQPALVWPTYIVDPQVGLGFGRARGPFVSPEGMGAACLVTAAAALCLTYRRFEGARGWRAVAIASASLSIIGISLSFTRAVWIASVLGALIVFAVSRRSRRGAARWVGGMLGVATVTFMLLPGLRERFFDRGTQSDSVNDRLASNEAAVRAVLEHPLTGVGWGQFRAQSAEWVRQSPAYPINNVVIEVHNVVLSRAVELGVPAALLLLLLLARGPLLDLKIVSHIRRFEKLGPGARSRGDVRGEADWLLLSFVLVITWIAAAMFGPMATSFPAYVMWLIAGVAASMVSEENSVIGSPNIAGLRKSGRSPRTRTDSRVGPQTR